MSIIEVTSLLKEIQNKNRDEWEKLRWSGYITAVSAGAKFKLPTDLILFEWEKQKYTDTRTNEEVAAELIEIFNKGPFKSTVKN